MDFEYMPEPPISKEERFNEICGQIFTAIDEQVSLMERGEVDEFLERIHSHLYETSRARIHAAKAAVATAILIDKTQCKACDHPGITHNFFDGLGCGAVELTNPGDHINPPEYKRCHCGEFVKK